MNSAIAELVARLRAAGVVEGLEQQVPLAAYTTFGIGGVADLAFEARSSDALAAACRAASACDIPCLVLGRGSNVLVSDRGVRGLVIINRTEGCVLAPDGRLTAVSGTSLTDVARRSAEAGWAGLEWAVGIPGSVGGAIVGNAGAHGGYIGDVLEAATVLDHGEVRRLGAADLGFGYRTSRLKEVATGNGRPVVLEATFSLRPGVREALERQMDEWLAWRSDRHPQEPSAGSVFKRTAQYPAGFLIEQAGLKGHRRGDALVAPEHANFIVNVGAASADDVRALIEEIQEEVEARFGVRLELEIELVGDWQGAI
ncbi:MAG: UDP-N-acetylmuramate dehydrogenase [Anaerolineae bacterium]